MFAPMTQLWNDVAMETSWEEFHELINTDPEQSGLPTANDTMHDDQALDPQIDAFEELSHKIFKCGLDELDFDKLYTPSQTAALLHIKVKTLTRWARIHRIDAIRTLGGHRRFHADAIIRAVLNIQRPQDVLELPD